MNTLRQAGSWRAHIPTVTYRAKEIQTGHLHHDTEVFLQGFGRDGE
jgi:hypothetical protein